MGSSQANLVRSTDGGEPTWPTSVALSWNASGLGVRFECRDDRAWATLTKRDAPLWQEEVVEVFLAPGIDDPREYFEIEINPLGALFDARVSNPDDDRATMRVDESWDWPGIVWRAGRLDRQHDWWAELVLPWRGLGLGKMPRLWRANFFRVERPRGIASSDDEYSAWSPSLVDPADFHRPSSFGLLVVGEEPTSHIEAIRNSGRPVLVVPERSGNVKVGE